MLLRRGYILRSSQVRSLSTGANPGSLPRPVSKGRVLSFSVVKGALTVVFAPATEVLVEVEGGCAITHLDIRQPLGDDVQEGGVEPNGGADDGDDDPSLRGLVEVICFMSPVNLAGIVQVGGVFPACLAAEALPGGILNPVCSSRERDGGRVGGPGRRLWRMTCPRRTYGRKVLRRVSVVIPRT